MSRIPYGYTADQNGNITVNKQEFNIIQFIFQSYLSGDSLGKITDKLLEKKISSPSGKNSWTRAALDKLLSDGRYVPYIIREEQFFEVQIEKANRSNIDLDTGKRKTTRYNSQNVLSGLLICGECGANYRRITPASGEVVWRCANRVEEDKYITGKQSPSIKEAVVISFICDILNMSQFDPQIVRNSLSDIVVNNDDAMSVEHKQLCAMEFSL